jgi:energy-coupling factor transporter ATP-binding protein EcfA2
LAAQKEGGGMPNTITIKNLKHIKNLVFEVPPPGVHLLSGANGAGKTSVLACLRRIGHRQAFAYHFAASQQSTSLDNMEGAEIIYQINDRQVTYAYGGERWVPRPRSENRLLNAFGYPDVIYIGATADRITPRPDDFVPRRVNSARDPIKQAANEILETEKFDALCTINLTSGAGNSAFLLKTSAPRAPLRYISERNFSLGELCVIKLIRDLTDCVNNSLVLIDELELALHPRAQINLLSYLERISAEKHLTVIFSTHSVSLLKRVRRRQILFLESNDGVVTGVRGCYPTYALGNIALDEERATDVVIYVEDECARHVTDALTRLCISARFNGQPATFPVVHVVPIGPFISVVRFLPSSRALLPNTTTSVVMLDGDVKEETLVQWRQAERHALLAEFQAYEDRISYLPWTPEVGLIDYVRNNGNTPQQALRAHLNNHQINIRQNDIGNIPEDAGSAKRDACKAALQRISRHVADQIPGMTEEGVVKEMFLVFARWHFEHNRAAVMALIGPLLA